MRSLRFLLACLIVLCNATLLAQTNTTPTFSVVANLGGSLGSEPLLVTLAEDSSGNLWGTTSSNGSLGDGTVFSSTTGGTVTVVYNFQMATGYDPDAGVVLGLDGNFYGTTSSGGSFTDGVVYQLTPAGVYTVLHNFSGTNEGKNPINLILGQDGNFYGTTASGGTDPFGGTIFKITPSGVLTTLYNFNSAQSSEPGPLVQASDGSFYGATHYGGGSSTCSSGCGTVFHLTSSGTLTTLHNFSGNDGSFPEGLTIGKDGKLYGTTGEGGDLTRCGKFGCGTVFKMTPSGTFKTLHVFEGTDGALPGGALTQGPDGNFYGVVAGGLKPNIWGAVYGITPRGSFKVLHFFASTDGYEPEGTLLLHSDGKFYGTTQLGGTNLGGVIYSVDLGFSIR